MAWPIRPTYPKHTVLTSSSQPREFGQSLVPALQPGIASIRRRKQGAPLLESGRSEAWIDANGAPFFISFLSTSFQSRRTASYYSNQKPTLKI